MFGLAAMWQLGVRHLICVILASSYSVSQERFLLRCASGPCLAAKIQNRERTYVLILRTLFCIFISIVNNCSKYIEYFRNFGGEVVAGN